MAWNTGSSSPGELLMTRSTSEVAVCCWSRFAQLTKQAGVLDGDDCLCGEVLNQLDLLVRKRTNFLTIDGNRTDKHVVLQQRDGKKRTDAGNLYAGDRHRVAFNGVRRFGLKIGDVYDLLGFGDAHDRSLLARSMHAALHELEIGLGHAKQGDRASDASVEAEHDSKLGIANARGLFQHGLEHGLKLAWRTADHLEHFRGRCLLLQCLAQVVSALAQFVE